MRFSIQGAGTQTATATSGTYSGIRVGLTSTTITDITVAVMENINILVTYQQANGGNYTVMSSNLLALSLADNIGAYELLNIDGDISAVINWGGPLNLSPGDNLSITVTVGTSVTGLVTTVSSESVVGIMEYIPIIQVFSVDPNRVNYAISLGNNVSRIALVNDAATSTTASQKISSCDIQSKEFSDNFIAQDFKALIAQQWTRDPSFYTCALYQGPSLTNANMNLNVNTSATSNAWVVVFSGVVNPITRANLANTLQKVAAKEAAQLL